MASHFQWYPSSESPIIPWNARYAFPSQANRSEKMTPRIPPKSGSAFAPGQVMRLEFPAQGYVNPSATTLEFDVTLYNYTASVANTVRFQNNIQSIFSRVRLLYGSTVIEDIINYNHIVRSLTEWTSTNSSIVDQTSITDGIGGAVVSVSAMPPPIDPEAASQAFFGFVNTRQKFIQGVTAMNNTTTVPNITMTPATSNFASGILVSVGSSSQTSLPAGVTGNGGSYTTRRYQVQLNLGLFNQEKLVSS